MEEFSKAPYDKRWEAQKLETYCKWILWDCTSSWPHFSWSYIIHNKFHIPYCRRQGSLGGNYEKSLLDTIHQQKLHLSVAKIRNHKLINNGTQNEIEILNEVSATNGLQTTDQRVYLSWDEAFQQPSNYVDQSQWPRGLTSWIVLARSNTGDPGFESHLRHRCLCAFILRLCCSVGIHLATGSSPVQGVLPTVYTLRNWKSGQGQQGL
jgi:hypothetical protein